MKYIIRFTLIFISCFPWFVASGQEIMIGNYEEVKTGDIYLTRPKWDNTGTKLIATGEHNKGLYLIDVKGNKVTQLTDKDGIGRNADWTANNEIIYRKQDKIKFLSNQKSVDQVVNDTFLYVNPRDKKVYLSVSGTNINKAVTEQSRLYYNPVLSPDKKKMVVHYKSEMLLMSLENSTSIIKLGFGLASSWSPDGLTVFFFRDFTSDGHQISNADIYAYSISENKTFELSTSDNYFEMWPDISPDGKNIVFSDEKTGKIFTAKILQNKK